MNRRQKIIVSVTGIFLVLLILVGLTYAYFLTRINGNPNDTSISVTTANLVLEYTDGNGVLTAAEPIMPGSTIKFHQLDEEGDIILDENGNATITETKTFSVENKGNATVEDYGVILENIAFNYASDATLSDGTNVKAGDNTYFEYPEDFKIVITCESSTGNKCKGITNEDDKSLPITNDVILTNDIAVGEKHNYEMTITYVDSGIDQSVDMNKTISGKINIIETKGTVDIEGTVTNYVAGDFVQTNSTKRTSNIVYDKENKVYKYKIVGLEPDTHTISLRYKDANGNEQIRSSQTINIEKGTTPNVNGTTITVNEVSRTVSIAIDSLTNSYTINPTIKEYNPYKEGTLAYTLMNDTKILKNETTPKFNGIATEEEGLYRAQDDYGDSWYFRGAQSNNYVNFAGYTWRVVRINGDGTVRLIKADMLRKAEAGADTNPYAHVPFNNSDNDNAYIGYMYGLPETTTDGYRCLVLENGVAVDKVADYDTKELCEDNNGKWTTTAYEATHANVVSSNIKTHLDYFYENYLLTYDEYISDTIFCNDKTIAPSHIGENNTQLGYGINETYYAAGERVLYSTAKEDTKDADPSLMCATSAYNNYSRFTVNKYTTNSGVETNGDLTYPIALLTADEVVMAGALRETANTSYYLNGIYDRIPTMTPGYFNGSLSSIIVTTPKVGYNNQKASATMYLLPVINIKADVLVDTGDGTVNSAYTLKLK